jgi:hypothetical protein
MSDKKVYQHEIDHAILTLVDQIQSINHGLITFSGETERELLEKIGYTRKKVNLIAKEVSNIFLETLDRCIDEPINEPSLVWTQDEYNNLRLDGNKKLYSPCYICGETRVSEYCHIIPRQIGGSNLSTNIVYLCPTHHSCFDKGVLTKAEFEALDLRGKSELAKSYVEEVLRVRQELHWNSNFAPKDMAYHSFEPLTKWITKVTGCESVDKWNAKRKNKMVIRYGRHQLG